MDKAEAARVLATELVAVRKSSYEDLVALIDTPKRTIEVVAPSGLRYYIDVLVCWDGAGGGNLRVVGSIDDGGVRAFVPLTDGFIKAPDGSFVGEDP